MSDCAERNDGAAVFAGHGGLGGARAIEHLRGIAAERTGGGVSPRRRDGYAK